MRGDRHSGRGESKRNSVSGCDSRGSVLLE